MTASPEQYSRASIGWLIYTADGLVVSGPHVTEAEARLAGNGFAAELRASMQREHYNPRQVAARIRVLRVGYGRRSHPHGGFEEA